ncbi:TPA: ABC transporter ATP-binding protein [Candidatus Nomurabacteria bacterium]|nr:MAG: ABC transporter ATP binding protein [Candidatus Nomurabacteria bacterium GW2011_GWF2_36_126]KKP96380.1 MAG: ABC transporter ATP binding protein [Candidatus Nomurabacteria bacterium GW2011_GWD2_36_14]KKP99122.1 MAG: ABC transporter ATP binding protein [Candidatus Nomurabacteria bacterium GW2011_GWF2_36_19]KKQ04951.1 MAG: ABC transporter ATP binding protein [Candidatus Nomurabacteria bacterium GW2011_GWF1_36_47]KKQ08483.1 MAG: ABC transporter ATP binding protein [Candidatus Nomurabacteria
MKNSPIITVKNISKKYNINHQQGGYIALRDVITNIFKNPFTFLKTKTKEVLGIETKEEFWALKDINFEIMKGEVIGIVGRNGAGKSTLLKILSQITPPTTGEIRINGTVGSLLEVGTGFHPELTGRENIFLNGAILGMKKKDIVRKFDEIVKFADIEKFLDTPVKYYSSGMYVRLAFSVAAHMETDILIIDEVLAVGDAEFQKKCLGKMNEITKEEGRTILFVSHNMGSVKQLCNKTILLSNGKIIDFGETENITEKYLSLSKETTSEKWENKGNEFNNEYFKPEKFYISKEKDDSLWVNIETTINKLDESLTVGYALYSEDNTLLYWSYQTDSKESDWPELNIGNNKIKSKLPTEIFNSGIYKIELIASLYFKEWIISPNNINPTIFFNFSKKFNESKYWVQKRPGIITPNNQWKIIK